MQLFKKKNDDGGKAPAKKEEKISGLSLGKINLISFLVTTIIVLLSAYFSYLIYAARIELHNQDINQASLNKIAFELDGRLKTLLDITKQFTATETTLIQISQSSVEHINPDLEHTLKLIYPSFIRALVLTEKNSDPIDSLKPPYSYACVHLAMNTGTSSKYDVHRLHTQDQHIDLVIPLSTINKKLLVTLNISIIKQWIEPLFPGSAYVSLYQISPGQSDSMMLLKLGNEAFANNKTMISTTINNGNWQVNLATAQQDNLLQLDHLFYLFTFLVAVILIALGYLLVSLLSDKLIKNDLENLVKYLHTASKGAKKNIVPVRLIEFIKAMKAIDHLVEKMGKRAK